MRISRDSAKQGILTPAGHRRRRRMISVDRRRRSRDQRLGERRRYRRPTMTRLLKMRLLSMPLSAPSAISTARCERALTISLGAGEAASSSGSLCTMNGRSGGWRRRQISCCDSRKPSLLAMMGLSRVFNDDAITRWQSDCAGQVAIHTPIASDDDQCSTKSDPSGTSNQHRRAPDGRLTTSPRRPSPAAERRPSTVGAEMRPRRDSEHLIMMRKAAIRHAKDNVFNRHRLIIGAAQADVADESTPTEINIGGGRRAARHSSSPGVGTPYCHFDNG